MADEQDNTQAHAAKKQKFIELLHQLLQLDQPELDWRRLPKCIAKPLNSNYKNF